MILICSSLNIIQDRKCFVESLFPMVCCRWKVGQNIKSRVTVYYKHLNVQASQSYISLCVYMFFFNISLHKVQSLEWPKS